MASHSDQRRSTTLLLLALSGILGASVASKANEPQETAPLGHNQSQPAPLVQENKTVRVSDHVYVIPDGRVNLVPNIGMIVGTRATLIVDAGMGPRNGQAVLRELAKVNKNSALYFTTTHFHPEHMTGVQAFPANTIVVRPEVQQEEVDRKQPEFIHNFSQRTPEMKALLQDVRPRAPDIIFDREAQLDLGGVTVRLFSLGPAHTRGDSFILVEQDGVLFTGDVVINRFFPIFPDADASGKSWVAILDEIDELHPHTIVPGHGEVGDATLIGTERTYLRTLQSRVVELKGQGKSADESVKLLSVEFRAKYPDWDNPGWIGDAVKRFYAEAQ
ncbi:MAG TPA: MBL fold metallo-hydrolase [Candidatus Acidoferrales bacterium]|jgi:glyoxylase-like metal-dependent hydrolase (beta-lactamase superfamily II)|nr:MBL fold metallo-hydrolase [Candidatus Acidoferrales bacterium]